LAEVEAVIVAEADGIRVEEPVSLAGGTENPEEQTNRKRELID
jgi:hypothetical protein